MKKAILNPMLAIKVIRKFITRIFLFFPSGNDVFIIIDELKLVRIIKTYYQSSYVSKVKIIWDIGSSTGSVVSLYLRLFPKAVIYAMEPTIHTFNKFSKYFDGNTRVVPLNYAGSNKENTAKLYHGGTDPQNSLNSPRLWKGTYELVSTRRIDTLCDELSVDRINILKIDVEGHDLQVLHGAERLFSEGRVDLIIVECSFNNKDLFHANFIDINDYLSSFNYNVCGFNELHKFSRIDEDKIFTLRYCDAIFARS